MQNSTQWHRTVVVYPKPHIPRMGEERILVVNSPQSYASPNILPFISINPSVFSQPVRGKEFFGTQFQVYFCDREFISSESSAIIEDIKDMRKALKVSRSATFEASWHLFSSNSATTLTDAGIFLANYVPRVAKAPKNPVILLFQDVSKACSSFRDNSPFSLSPAH